MTFATTTELMAHQEAAVAKVLPSKVGALFMDMGTGKSRTTIELAKVRMAKGKIDKIVWVVPVSVKAKIRDEILKHTDCTESDIVVFDEKITDSDIPPASWYIVGIESVGSSTRVTLALSAIVDDMTMMVVDESGYIKNERAVRSKRLILIGEKAKYRLILTGTPITQGIEDLYSQMKFLSPNILGYRSWWAFRNAHIQYSDRNKGQIVRRLNIDYLAAKMQPYVYQVRRQDCIDLPTKIYSTRRVSLSSEQKEAYEKAKSEFIEEMLCIGSNDPFNGTIAIFRLFTRLQTIVSGFESCVSYEEYRTEAAISAAAEAPDDEKIVIWTRWRHSLSALVEKATARWGANAVCSIHGDINERARERELNRWKKSGKILILTQSVGGHGIDLVESNTVIFHSDGYKYSERLQAEDRCHRIGQTKKVLYVTIETISNIDQRISSSLFGKSNALTNLRNEIEKVKGKGRDSVIQLIKSM